MCQPSRLQYASVYGLEHMRLLSSNVDLIWVVHSGLLGRQEMIIVVLVYERWPGYPDFFSQTFPKSEHEMQKFTKIMVC